jgi:hypothetical protein
VTVCDWTLHQVGKGRKYLAEYVDDNPRCGTWLPIEDNDLQPLQASGYGPLWSCSQHPW